MKNNIQYTQTQIRPSQQVLDTYTLQDLQKPYQPLSIQRQRPKIIETDVTVYTLVDKSVGDCGGNPTLGYTTTQYDPCVKIPKGKQVGDIYDDGRFATKDEKLGRNVFFKPNEYTKKSELQKKYLMYGLIAVVGYFAYKKLNK